MMSSRVLSRLLPVAEGDISVYEGLRRDAARQTDLESQRDEPVAHPFHDDEEDPATFLYDHHGPPSAASTPEQRGKSAIDEDDDVPASLMLEARGKSVHHTRASSSKARTAAQLRAAQERYGVHPARPGSRSTQPQRRHVPSTTAPPRSDPRAQAMWMYTNAGKLDVFLHEVYQYFSGHGVYSIQLARLISLLSETFVFCFAMFLTTCIDYSKVRSSKSTSEVLILQCMAKAAWWKNMAIFIFVIYWLYTLVKYVCDTPRLLRMHDFYLYVLGISDEDIQTVSWVRVVDGLVKIQNANIATSNPPLRVKNYTDYHRPQQRVTAETIANRLLRQTNYYVALYNKDLLDFTLPVPFMGHRQFYSKSLEWCIEFCFTNFIFDEQGSIRTFCLDVKNRRNLVLALQRRLQFAALTSVLVAPFNIARFCVLYFLRYYTEFSRNPSKASTRTFTPWAEWKIREFNELDHLFQVRLRQAHPFASDYLKQFPKDKMDQAFRFVAFITGALAAVLAIFSLIDNELITQFEITPGRTALFWLTALFFVFGVANGMVPDEHEVHNPVWHLQQLLYFTHYMPSHWKNKLHSNEVRAEFSAMYQLKIQVFVEEILSIIVAPIILLRNANHHSERIIDFFRENTVHVDGIGHQCNFAVFGFKKNPNTDDPAVALKDQDGLRDDYYGLKDDKMASSVAHFAQYYSHYQQHRGSRRHQGGWQPPPAWPPMPSYQSAIAEESDPRIAKLAPRGTTVATATATATAAAAAAAARRSGFLSPPDPRQHRSPRQVPHSSSSSAPRDHRNKQQTSESSATAAATGMRSPPLPPAAGGVSESVLMRQDSDLHDYHDGPSKDKLLESDDMDGDEEDEDGGNGAAGVLGMLYQYSKKQTEAGARVNI